MSGAIRPVPADIPASLKGFLGDVRNALNQALSSTVRAEWVAAAVAATQKTLPEFLAAAINTTTTGPVTALVQAITDKVRADSFFATLGTAGPLLEQVSSSLYDPNTGAMAQWYVKTDINGVVSGFGLAADVTDGSRFYVRADVFAVGAPGTTDPGATGAAADDPAVPFVVYTTPQTINGVTIPPGVYMKAAFIAHLSADRIDVGTLQADRIVSGSLSKLTAYEAAAVGSLLIPAGDPGAGRGWTLTTNGAINYYHNPASIGATVHVLVSVTSYGPITQARLVVVWDGTPHVLFDASSSATGADSRVVSASLMIEVVARAGAVEVDVEVMHMDTTAKAYPSVRVFIQEQRA